MVANEAKDKILCSVAHSMEAEESALSDVAADILAEEVAIKIAKFAKEMARKS